MRSLQVLPLPPDVESGQGLIRLPGGAIVADTTSARRELMHRHRSGFGYEGYNGAVAFKSESDPPVADRYGYPSDDYSEESTP